MRRAAAQVLGHLDPEELATYSAVLIARFEDGDAKVRQAAALSLGKLELADLRAHLDAVKRLIIDQDERVRKAARHVLEDFREREAAAAVLLRRHERRVNIAANSPGSDRRPVRQQPGDERMSGPRENL